LTTIEAVPLAIPTPFTRISPYQHRSGRTAVSTSVGWYGDTWLYGGDGDDELEYGGFGKLFGGNGNDRLITMTSFISSESLLGEGGNDCLEDRSGAAFVFDCGNGFDTKSTHFGNPMSVNCEITISASCPF
jgi:Ca2+-binding RTX toxin-like protein